MTTEVPAGPLTKQQLAMLMSPLFNGRVKTRNQGGQTLSYIEAFDVKATLIRLFGFGGFSAEVTDSKILEIITAQTHDYHVKSDGKAKTPQVLAQSTVTLHIPSLGATYAETAIGSNSAWDIGDAADNAIKTASSDALKRCATYLGTQFGLGLYRGGDLSEVVEVIFEPEQAEMLREINEERAVNLAAARERVQSTINTATGNGATSQEGQS